MAGVGEEVGVGLEGIVIHVPSALLHRHGVGAGVGLSAGLLQVAVGKGDGQSALLDVGEQLAGGVESRHRFLPTGAVICLPLNVLQGLLSEDSPFLVGRDGHLLSALLFFGRGW